MPKKLEQAGKRRGKHRVQELDARTVRTETRPGRWPDGNGLYLMVDPNGAKRWVLRLTVQGKRRDFGLGGVSTVSLAQARDKAAEYRRIAREGGDPALVKKREGVVIPTFKAAAEIVHNDHSKAWKNEKHAAQWISTLEEYVFPLFGDEPVNRIESAQVLRALSPIWLTKPETASRVRQRIGTVLDWAKTAGFRSGENPVHGITKGLPKQPKKAQRVQHHAALPYADLPDFIKALRKANVSEGVKLAFELLILTATRTSEVIEAEWSEIDLKDKVWTIPAIRMKAKKEHAVPLSDRCVAIIERARELAGDSDYLFPGYVRGKPLSNMAFLMTLRRMGYEVTAHGFRSTFRDWAAEKTHFPNHVCEAALAHSIKDKVEEAYRRTTLFEKRVALMTAWSTYGTGNGNVVPFRAAAA